MTIDELEKLEKAATPGPWYIPANDRNTDDLIRGPNDMRIAGCCCCGGFNYPADEQLIIAMRNSFPKFLRLARAAYNLESVKE